MKVQALTNHTNFSSRLYEDATKLTVSPKACDEATMRILNRCTISDGFWGRQKLKLIRFWESLF